MEDCVCDLCSAEKQEEGKQAAQDLMTKLHASTNVIMNMEHNDDTMRELFDKCVRVPAERKDQLRAEWKRNSKVADERLSCACGSCGLRDPTIKYEKVKV